MDLRKDADIIIKSSLEAVLPDEAVKAALSGRKLSGRLHLIAIGKAAWQMAAAALDALGEGAAGEGKGSQDAAGEGKTAPVLGGLVVTKHDHSMGPLPPLEIIEAGHPVPDGYSFEAGRRAAEYAEKLGEGDTLIFLVSGGASALFELPLIDPAELSGITEQLLACGASIQEMNYIRKRLSAVKGGKFAKLCAPAKIFQIVLSDVLGDDLETIASAPAYPDSSTCADAFRIVEKYGIRLSEEAVRYLNMETPKELDGVETLITGSVRVLVSAAAEACEKLGYRPEIIADDLRCEAKDAGAMLAELAVRHQNAEESLAFIAGGETVVKLTGRGLGGRNQEIALSAAEGIAGLRDTAVFSIGSDGTDGPTDAAGGYADGGSRGRLAELGMSIPEVLAENDSYHALEKIGGLIKTGPTGTNVNDVSVLLIKR